MLLLTEICSTNVWTKQQRFNSSGRGIAYVERVFIRQLGPEGPIFF